MSSNCQQKIFPPKCIILAKLYHGTTAETTIRYKKTMLPMLTELSPSIILFDKDIYSLELMPKHEEKSKKLDGDYHKPKEHKQYILAMNHLWRRSIFTKFVKTQLHHLDDKDKIGA